MMYIMAYRPMAMQEAEFKGLSRIPLLTSLPYANRPIFVTLKTLWKCENVP